jgi:hypothetical protein
VKEVDMVDFIGWQKAMELAHAEPVIFVEIMGEAPGARSLEVHVMSPSGVHLHELERDDTGLVPLEDIQDVVARIAASRNVRYAAIRRAEDRWPPPWA